MYVAVFLGGRMVRLAPTASRTLLPVGPVERFPSHLAACSKKGASYWGNAAVFLAAQVDLLLGAADPEPHCLIGRASIKTLIGRASIKIAF